MSNVSEREQIWGLVERCNSAWLSGRPEDTPELFDERVVMAAPDGSVLARGRDAMVRIYVDYVAHVQTHAFEVIDHNIEVFDDTACIDYRFDVDYELSGQRRRERGREILFARQNPTGWHVVWRTQLLGER